MNKFLEKSAIYIFLILLAYMPFHVFLSTWIGVTFGILDVLKALKDVVLLVGVFLSVIVLVNEKNISHIFKNKIVILISIFILLNTTYFFIFDNYVESEILSLVYGVRFLLFFVYGYLITQFKGFDKDEFIKKVKKIVIYSGIIVAFVGISQVMYLPDNLYDSFGYSDKAGTPANYYIGDSKQDERAFSTLKDPNSLGSYMIIIILILIAEVTKKKSRILSKKVLYSFIVISTLCLTLTYSRSAALGLLVAVGIYFYFDKSLNPKIKKFAGIAVLTTSVLCILAVLIFRNSYFIQTVVFHIDETTVSENTSNSIRSNAIKESIERIQEKPLGEGLGTAGPSALKNTEQKVGLTENHYLQVAVELGIIGLSIFIAITVLLAIKLYKIKDDNLSLAVLASFMGLIITNNLVHIWSNEAVAYTWWGIAGIVIYSSLVKRSYKEPGKDN